MRTEHIRTLAREIPAEQLLTETDNPGGPKGFIGRMGRPALLKDLVEGLADARGTTAEGIEQTVQANVLVLIRDDPRLMGSYGDVLGTSHRQTRGA